MSDTPNETTVDKSDGKTAIVIYILYLLALIFGITPLIGVIIAYAARGGNPLWVESHYRFQIRACWIGLAAVMFISVTAVIESDSVGILFFLILFTILLFLWWIIRNARGLTLAAKVKAIPDPASWGLGGKGA